MEDSAGDLALILPSDDAAIAARLREARQAADDIQWLLAAAQVLHRRCLQSADQD